jgi:acetyl esterase/lipase/sugar phosphate isomerase/epimerase
VKIAWLLLGVTAAATAAESFTVESNVVYGMYSGAALLLDIYKPANPKGVGIVHISGSGWTAPLAYNAPELKTNGQSTQYASALASNGYTVFVINHRALPRFRFPDPVEDAQRAVRFVRHNAARFGIRADRIGASGGSSGGHLVSMLGLLDGDGNAQDPDPVERESAKVQCVVARAAPTDFFKGTNGQFLTGMPRPAADAPMRSAEYRTYFDASPVSHITADDPPFLLMHGDKDDQVDFSQSVEFAERLKAAKVEVKLLRIPGGGHGATFPGAVNPPDYLGEMVRWFDAHLLNRSELFVFDNGAGRDVIPLPEQAALAKRIGFAGMLFTGTKNIPEMLALHKARGMRMLGIYTGMNVSDARPGYDPGLPRAIEQMKGSGALITFIVQGKSAEGDAIAVSTIREVADLAAKAGLKVALYPHYGFHMARIEDALRIRELTGRENVGVIFNLCHWLRSGDAEANLSLRLRQMKPHLLMVSINGSDREGDWDRLIQPLDRGSYDVGALLAELRKIDFNGPIGLQCYNIKGDREENLTRSMAAWRKLTAAGSHTMTAKGSQP